MYYSQFSEDKWIEENLKPVNGFFIDVGAGKPKELSNTYHFESKGWEGICIEADPNLIPELEMERANVLHSAVSDYSGDIVLHKGIISDWNSTIKNANSTEEQVVVKVMTLDDVIKSNNVKQIDLLSVDVEGAELKVLKGLTLLKPKIIIVEHTHNDIDELVRYLLKEYKLVHITTANLILQMV